MDNSWQQRLDTLLPYSLHNDWPAKRTDLTNRLITRMTGRAPRRPSSRSTLATDYQVSGPGMDGMSGRSTCLQPTRLSWTRSSLQRPQE